MSDPRVHKQEEQPQITQITQIHNLINLRSKIIGNTWTGECNNFKFQHNVY